MLLHTEKDNLVTRPQAESLFENLRGEKQFERFTGLGNESLVKSEPDRWKRLVSHFLARHSAP
jgi:hypothetical protein